MTGFVVKGDICYSADRNTIDCTPNGFLVIENGTIGGVFPSLPQIYSQLPLHDYTGHLVIPGMSDLHLHAPQYQYRGLWMDMQLLEWLEKHTFPEEARYSDLSYAREAYTLFADKLLTTTTTRISAFATIHKEATLLLAALLEERGLKGYVGKVNMDRNSPDILIEESEESVKETISFIQSMKGERIRPIITPRFIPSCSDYLLDQLGAIVKERSLPVQSHLSENLGEIEWVKELSPEAESYADAYRRHGLWCETPTIMAHCVWSDKYDGALMENGKLFIAHCPDSNVNLASGVANIGHFLDKGVHVGLGTDIAGGASISIFQSCAEAIRASKLRYRLLDQESHILTFPEAFYLATVGGGAFFGKVGSFAPGYEADFTVLDESGLESTIDFTSAERLERYCYLAGERPVLHKAVGGRILF